VKIAVRNLPVRTVIDADVEIEDGPFETIDERIHAALRDGHWQRSGTEALEELDLVLDGAALVRWEFDLEARG